MPWPKGKPFPQPMRDNIGAAMRGKNRGATNPMWKGGRVEDSAGYVLISQPDHPHAMASGYVREHRLIVEAAIGRHLAPSEHVHHRNGDRRDNRLVNLELVSQGEHQHIHHRGAKRTRETRRKISAAAEARWDRTGRQHKTCRQCGASFRARDKRRNFCDTECSTKWRKTTWRHTPESKAKMSETRRRRAAQRALALIKKSFDLY